MSNPISSQPARPIVLISHGSWHTPAHYHPLIHALTANGFPTICPPHPSCSNEVPLTASLADDIASIRTTALDLISRGHTIICIMHSYGGLVGTEGLAGLGFHERAARHESGGVIALIYMASFMVPVGASLDTPLGDRPPPIVLELENGTRVMDDPWLRLYSTDMATPPTGYTPDPSKLDPKAAEMGWLTSPMPGPPATSSLNAAIKYPSADTLMSMLTRQLSSATSTPIKGAAYASPGMHVTYLVCERDMALPPAAQRGMIGQMRDAGVEITEEVCQGGHSPFLSVPGEVAAVVEKVWKRAIN
ncbi:Alpha/beta hydrolase fold-1 [Phaeosphaeria sp. MPI-PUGE-AT-0046c]|nr:Alpha/beta hydrolase fold-1 [Phaeosphaeria sp. MPI-PUGE-AT-0046c]